jgi:hypothetical protein
MNPSATNTPITTRAEMIAGNGLVRGAGVARAGFGALLV